MAEAKRTLEETVNLLSYDMRRVKTDLYGPDDDNSGIVGEFRAEQTMKLTKQDLQHKTNRRMMLLVAAVPVVLKLLEWIHIVPR